MGMDLELSAIMERGRYALKWFRAGSVEKRNRVKKHENFSYNWHTPKQALLLAPLLGLQPH